MRGLSMALALSITFAAPALGQTPPSGYDVSTPIQIEGVIQRLDTWRLRVVVDETREKSRVWSVDLGHPDAAGLRDIAALKPGTPVKVKGRRSKTSPYEMAATAVVLPGGRTLALTAAPGWTPFADRFNMESPVLLKGPIVSSDGSGRPATITMLHEVPGTPEAWVVNVDQASGTDDKGLDPAVLTPGTVVIVRGYQAKDGSRQAGALRLNLADGIKLRSGAPRTLGQ